MKVELTQNGTFATFPDFTRLTIDDREMYEQATKDFPPACGMSFYNLMTWWNTLDSCAVSTLNGNLILSYWMPGDERMSGLSVLGDKHLDKTFATIFDTLRERNEPAKLVRIPEFVVSNMKYPELYHYKHERFADEYIYNASKFSKYEGLAGFKKMRVKKFFARHDEKTLEVRPLDLSIPENKQLLIDKEKELRKYNVFNFAAHVRNSFAISMANADKLGTKNVCVFVDGQLEGYAIYSHNSDAGYVTFNYAVINMRMPYFYDYYAHAVASWLEGQGVQYINLDSDMGVPGLRIVKLALGPERYFRFYTVKPVKAGI